MTDDRRRQVQRRRRRRGHRGGAPARGARRRAAQRQRRPPSRGRSRRGRARRLRRGGRGGRRGRRPRGRGRRRGRARRRVRRPRRGPRGADEAVVIDATTDGDPEAAVEEAATGRRSVDPSRRVVRRAHAVRLREEGHRQPPCPHPEHEHGGQDLRGRHPDGGRRRVQERPEADRATQGLPRLPARALPHGRRVVVLHPQHPRRDRLRRAEPPGPEAHAAHPP